MYYIGVGIIIYPTLQQYHYIHITHYSTQPIIARPPLKALVVQKYINSSVNGIFGAANSICGKERTERKRIM